jgi:hypothetical protein
MKKCKFCAEEIQNEARICRHCKKLVRGGWLTPGIKLSVLFLLAALVLTNWPAIRGKIRDVRSFAGKISVTGASILESIEGIKKGIVGLSKYQEKLEGALGDAEKGDGPWRE